MKKIILILTLIFLPILSTANTVPTPESPQQQNILRVIPLRYKTADQLIPSIKPFLSPGSVIEGNGSKLIVKTNPQNLNEVNRLVQQLDRPPIMFLVTVRREGGNDNIALTEKPVKVISTNNRMTRPLKQQVKVLEGKRVFIGSGQTFPVRDYNYGYYGYPNGGQVTYTTVESGFYLTSRLSGSNALVDIKWAFQSLENNQPIAKEFSSINNEAVSTNMMVPLGEWTKISNQSERVFHEQGTKVYDTNDLKHPASTVYIKVDIARS